MRRVVPIFHGRGRSKTEQQITTLTMMQMVHVAAITWQFPVPQVLWPPLCIHPPSSSSTSRWGGRAFSSTDEELRLRVMLNSLGCLTQHQNLKQGDSETVPSLTQILKIVKNDPSCPVANYVDKLKLSRRCLWSHIPPMEKAHGSRNAADNLRNIWPLYGRCHQTNKVTQWRKAKNERFARPAAFPPYTPTNTASSKTQRLRFRMTEDPEWSRKGTLKNYQERRLSRKSLSPLSKKAGLNCPF